MCGFLPGLSNGLHTSIVWAGHPLQNLREIVTPFVNQALGLDSAADTSKHITPHRFRSIVSSILGEALLRGVIGAPPQCTRARTCARRRQIAAGLGSPAS